MNSYRELYLELRSTLGETASECGLGVNEFLILRYLADNSDASLSEVARSIHCKESQCSVWVNNLTKCGLVSRVRDEGDRRRLFLKTTEDGEKKLGRLIGEGSNLRSVMEQAFDFSSEEMETMIGFNQRILQCLSRTRGSGQR